MVVVFTKFDAQKVVAFGELLDEGKSFPEAMIASASSAKEKFRSLEQRVNSMGYKCVYLEGLILFYQSYITN